MNLVIINNYKKSISDEPIEIVERKGIGHPDSLADGIAENFSVDYSNYCLKKFGSILPHWVDKVLIVGGKSEVNFGKGSFIKPIEVYIAGKLTEAVGNKRIPIQLIAKSSAKKYIKNILKYLDVKKNLKIILKTNNSVGAGRDKYWYQPMNIKDLKTITTNLRANDAVIATAYANLSETEQITLELEKFLNSEKFKKLYPVIGTDIKILSIRTKNKIDVTVCIPFIANLTPNRKFYDRIKKEVKIIIFNFVSQRTNKNVNVFINTRDSKTAVYMTVTGTTADTGDCGVTGRGNRINGLISPLRETAIEAPCGKNPLYHPGKLYLILANNLANDIFRITGCENYVNIVSQTGRKLNDPFLLLIKIANASIKKEKIEQIVITHLNNISGITKNLLKRNITLF